MADREERPSRRRRERAPVPRSRGRVTGPRHAADGDLRFARTFSIAFETLGARAAALVLAPLGMMFLLGGGIGLVLVLVAGAIGALGGAIFGIVAVLFYVLLMSFLFAFMTDVAHAHIAGRPDTWSDSFGTGFSRSLSVAAILLLVGVALVVLVVGAGAATAVGPAAVVAAVVVLALMVAAVRIMLWTAIPACVAEGEGAFAAMAQSFRTVRGNLGRVLPIALVAIVLSAGANMLVQAVIAEIDSVIANLLALCVGLLILAFELAVATATYHILSGSDHSADVDADVFA